MADNAPRDARKVPISLPVRTDRIKYYSNEPKKYHYYLNVAINWYML